MITKGFRPVYFKSAGEYEFDENTRKVSGYLAAFGNKDSDSDIIVKGAFSKSLSERGVNSTTARKIAYLKYHDFRLPLGKFTTLNEDDKGLYFEAEIDNTALGDETLIQYASGTLNQHSIGFQYIWDKIEYSENDDAFIVKEVSLWEGSVVTMGANENTPFTGFKSADLITKSDELRREFDKILSQLEPDKAYELRKLMSKSLALNETKPEKPLETVIIEPQKRDWNKIISQL